MIIYALSGLGADARVFEALTLHHEIRVLHWIHPQKDEPLTEYASRMSDQIDASVPFVLMGVSFGGLVAVEISKLLRPKKLILISSLEISTELQPLIRGIGKLGVVRLLPKSAFAPPKRLLAFLFGTDKVEMLGNIISDTDTNFAKWAANALLQWSNTQRPREVIRIHGDADRVLPIRGNNAHVHLIQNGGHFMIVDRADEISLLINSSVD